MSVQDHGKSRDERAPELKEDLEARPDDLGTDPSHVGSRSAGQAASSLGLSSVPDAHEESVEGPSDTDQAMEAASVEGPAHTHEEYGHPDDVPQQERGE